MEKGALPLQSLGSGVMFETAHTMEIGIVTEAVFTPKWTFPTNFTFLVPALRQSFYLRMVIDSGV